MQLVYLGCVFLTIVLLLTFRRPLYQAVLGGLFMTVLIPNTSIRYLEADNGCV